MRIQGKDLLPGAGPTADHEDNHEGENSTGQPPGVLIHGGKPVLALSIYGNIHLQKNLIIPENKEIRRRKFFYIDKSRRRCLKGKSHRILDFILRSIRIHQYFLWDRLWLFYYCNSIQNFNHSMKMLTNLAISQYTASGDGSILLRSKYLQRYTSTKIKFFGGFSEFLCLKQQNFHDYITFL